MSAITTHGSKALYLPGVEAKPQPGVYRDLIEAARNRGAEYSKIWDLFAFQQDFTSVSGAVLPGRAAEAGDDQPRPARADRRLHLLPERVPILHEGPRCRRERSCWATRMLVWKALKRPRGVAAAGEGQGAAPIRRQGDEESAGGSGGRCRGLAGGRVGRRGDLLRHHDLRPLQLLQPLGHRLRRAGDVSRRTTALQGKTLASRGYVRD